MTKRMIKSSWVKGAVLTGLTLLSRVASADILTSSNNAIDNISSLWSTVGKGGAYAFEFISAVLFFGSLIFFGGHALTAYSEAKKTGNYNGFAAWFISGVFVVAMVGVFALTVYHAAGDLSSIGSSNG